MTVSEFFTPENADTSRRKEHLSPSGKYKLVVTPYSTKPGAWNYTQGLVYEVGSDEPIAEIQRNYSSFPFLFVENHPNGHSYLVGGSDYQGQTVLELDTGEKRGLLPEEAKQGHGFCWSSYAYNEATKLLVVHGCYWACPYETRFYDFSDPMNGWPLLELVPQDEENGEGYLDDDDKEPTFEPDGTIVWYQSKDLEDDEREDDEEPKKGLRVVATRTFKREGLKLIEIASWVSEEEQKIRKDREEGLKAWEAWLTDYKANDPLYVRMRELVAQEPFKPADYMSSGTTHDGWCPDFKVHETRICRDIHHAGTFKVSLEIAAKTGPVKLIMSNSKEKSVERFFMEHSVASIEQAFVVAREFLAGDP